MLNLVDGTSVGTKEIIPPKSAMLYVFRTGGDPKTDREIGICVERGKSATRQMLVDAYVERSDDNKQRDIISAIVNQLKKLDRKFTQAHWKSLLQKLIRFRAQSTVFLDGYVAPTPLVVAITTIFLLTHPGSLIPELHQYVR